MHKQRLMLWIGVVFALLLCISYFVTFSADLSSNYLVRERLLGIIIFHNPFILALYVLIALFLIVEGLWKK